ncbi:substrate-binding periplasmic protein [Pleionea litopenaei]|uniref:Transporter substrate-binding domain-containing protein n=1 Tax=Pleionea litopenaei TaxID=3070815 RepID=A0AA51RQY5_9GAMM|nr:transporter substrate-binding domain-containing protein [Pleionea sp. HL-JVS1]WMS85986.1 transporter substrate-binding domain-containing protein [Pleionea sp. HL-JVS1]
MLRTAITYLSIATFGLVGCNNDSKNAEKSQKSQTPVVETTCSVTMGWDPWEPYMYLAPGNKVSGLDIELIQALAAESNCELNFVQDQWMRLLEKLEQGEVDLVAGASVTEKRKSYALFSEPYRAENFVLYVRSGEKDSFPKTFKDIVESGKKIGVTTDYIYGDQVSDFQDDPNYTKQFVYSSVGEANYYNLMQHNVDVIIEDPFVGAYNIKRKGIEDQIDKLDIQIHSGDVHLMFSMKSVDHTILTRFNEALKTLKANGKYKQILQKYML